MSEGIYLISNDETKNVYIGQSKDVDRRIITHFSHLRNNYHSNKYMQNEFNEFGEAAFKGILLEEIKDENKRKLREKELIDSDKYSVYNGNTKHVFNTENNPKILFLMKEIEKLKSQNIEFVNTIRVILERHFYSHNELNTIIENLCACFKSFLDSYLKEKEYLKESDEIEGKK